ncbi:MAG: PRC-barrel domain-containing protein, partial [Myxococcota bacterium]|nr:PRC-barrel domain-containing protein [Myxococcota bacterium]
EVAGWPVVSTDGEALGTVVRIVDGPTDLLEVRPVLGGETYFVPMVSEFVVDVDRQGSRVVIETIEGLVP